MRTLLVALFAALPATAFAFHGSHFGGPHFGGNFGMHERFEHRGFGFGYVAPWPYEDFGAYGLRDCRWRWCPRLGRYCNPCKW